MPPTRDAYVASKAAERQAAKDARAAAAAEAAAPTFDEGLLLKLAGLGDGTTRESLKEALGAFGEVRFADYSAGNADAIVRFAAADAAAAAAAKAGSEEGLTVDGSKVTAAVLAGEAEKEYWAKIVDNKNNRKRGRPGRGRHGDGPRAKQRRQ